MSFFLTSPSLQSTMRLSRATTAAILLLGLVVSTASTRSLHTVDGDEEVSTLDAKLPFLRDAGIKSRELDALNKTTSLRHWDPPTGGCAALLAAYPAGAPDSGPNSVTLPNGDVTLYNGWTVWTCMNVSLRVKGGAEKESW